LTNARDDLVKALENSGADLDTWIRKQGWNLDELCQMFIDILREDGFAARMILGEARKYIPVPPGVNITTDEMIKALAAIRSKQIAEYVPNQELASSAMTSEFETRVKDALPDLRENLLKLAKAGPQHRRGGRHEELADPKIRREIREKIKARRDSETTLQSIFKTLAAEYGVSPTKIKRVWLEPKQE
jgi:hypothetical protein